MSRRERESGSENTVDAVSIATHRLATAVGVITRTTWRLPISPLSIPAMISSPGSMLSSSKKTRSPRPLHCRAIATNPVFLMTVMAYEDVPFESVLCGHGQVPAVWISQSNCSTIDDSIRFTHVEKACEPDGWRCFQSVPAKATVESGWSVRRFAFLPGHVARTDKPCPAAS